MASNGPTLTFTEELPRMWWRATREINADNGPGSFPSKESTAQVAKAIWLVARRGSQVVGTCRGELASSQTAALFPPTLQKQESWTTGRLLLEILEEKLTREGSPIRLLQALTTSAQDVDAEVLKAAGFTALGGVVHMTCRSDIPALPGKPCLELEPFVDSPTNWNRLERVYEQTCVGTRDFPELDLLSGIELLKGYQSVGHFREELWQFAKLDGHDIGCLLVNELNEPEVCQLVYCGLIPAVRSRGLGKELANLGERLAARQGAKQLVLSVDKRNSPAIAAYQAAGFFIADQRFLFVKQCAK